MRMMVCLASPQQPLCSSCAMPMSLNGPVRKLNVTVYGLFVEAVNPMYTSSLAMMLVCFQLCVQLFKKANMAVNGHLPAQ